jgi:ABC-type transport system involved in cytochrome c biogenesis permease subunit
MMTNRKARFHAARLLLVCLAFAGLACGGVRADDLASWRRLPVLDDGRVMPLDTFARRKVETITNSQSPKLPMAGKADGPARKWDAAALLLDWLCRSDAWEDVPFLIAEHEEVRRLLDLPVFEDGPEGRKRLKHASPSDVADSKAFRERLVEIDDRRREARAKGEAFRLEGADSKVDQLWQAFVTFRQLSFRAEDAEMGRSRFTRLLESAIASWQSTERRIAGAVGSGEADAIRAGFTDILAAVGESTRFPTAEASAAVVKTRSAVAAARESAGAATAGRMLARLEERLLVLAESLYDNGDALLVVPALHAEALETERNADEDMPAWLALATLLDAPPELLGGYPAALVADVREAFASLKEAVTAVPPGDVASASSRLAEKLRAVGEAVEPERRRLPVDRLDADLIRWTAYPRAGSTDREVAYNSGDPFRMSWVLALAGLASFALAFGRATKPMFWLGTAFLLAEILWTAKAFAARIAITGWAPVTNMYETVIYVPFFLSLLGLWFLLSPIVSKGVGEAWRLTTHWSMILPRLAIGAGVVWVLAMAPYAAGGRTILRLTPQTDVDSWMPNANNLVVWLVGLCVLVPSVWYLPRVALAAVGSLATVPRSLRSTDVSEWISQAYARRSFGLVVTAVAFAGTFIAWFFPIPGKQFSPLQPVLRDNFWLTIHVLTIVSSYAAGALAWGLGCLSLGHYLFGSYRPATAGEGRGARPPEACDVLAGFIYRAMQVAVLLLAAGTILGGLWADVSWGRFWGWDPKEVWALVSLLAYLVVLHGRYAGWIDNFGLAAGSVLGAAVIGMSWYGVNFLLGAGLHSYGFGQGGQTEFFAFLAVNMLLLVAAAWRYRSGCHPAGA